MEVLVLTSTVTMTAYVHAGIPERIVNLDEMKSTNACLHLVRTELTVAICIATMIANVHVDMQEKIAKPTLMEINARHLLVKMGAHAVT